MGNDTDTSGPELNRAYIEDKPRAPGEHSPLAWLAIDRALRFLDGQPRGPLLYERHASLACFVELAIKRFGREVLPLLTTPLAIEGVASCLMREHEAKRQNADAVP